MLDHSTNCHISCVIEGPILYPLSHLYFYTGLQWSFLTWLLITWRSSRGQKGQDKQLTRGVINLGDVSAQSVTSQGADSQSCVCLAPTFLKVEPAKEVKAGLFMPGKFIGRPETHVPSIHVICHRIFCSPVILGRQRCAHCASPKTYCC